LVRRASLDVFRTLVANAKGTLQSLRFLSLHRPDLIVATGGYVSFPVALAARIRRLLGLSRAPMVLLEPNAAPGLTHRLLAPIVDEVWRSSPIRSSLRRLPSRDEAMTRLGLDASLRTLLAMGGSQGARAINDALLSLIASEALPHGWQVLHLTGKGDYERVAALQRSSLSSSFSTRYVVRSYLDDMADAYAVADLVVTRAGASTLGELSALGKPAILVPYPFATEAHQASNAARFEAAGAGVVVADAQLRAGELPGMLAETTRPERLAVLSEKARELEGSDPLAAILARIDNLVPRMSKQ
jgi:UDP-N-acetylglucosamine--N-acetylmuramyl-(pentapeptide) pyrophosphoryl-undecaprenol N-acetylglucosamine transferase